MRVRVFKLAAIFLLLILVRMEISAATVTIDDGLLKYTVDTETNTAEVDGLLSSSATINNLVIPDYVNYNGAQIPVTSIRSGAFSSNKELTGSLTIGNNIQIIGESAFESCYGFTGDVIIPNSVQTIGEKAFAYCDGFTGSLTIGNNVETIGEGAFRSCSGFTGDLTIGNSVQTIGRVAFLSCSGFTDDLIIPNSVQTIGEYAFQMCSGFTGSLTIGNSVQTIEEMAFSFCSGFTGDLIIPNSVQTIGVGAFDYCSGFTGALTIGNNVETIGEGAFLSCTRFTGPLTIGNSVKTIGYHAFSSCDFEYVQSLAIIPPQCVYHGGNKSVFSNYSYSKPLYVPAQSIDAYKQATEWEKFYSINPIENKVTAITLNKTDLTLSVGQEETLVATLTPEDASTQIVWSVEGNGSLIISIDQNGKVKALNAGEATVVATAGTVSARCNVTVTVPPGEVTNISVTPTTATVEVGKTVTLTATVTPTDATDKTVSWTSSDTAVATVDANGVVTGLAKGEVTVTATASNGMSATSKITVTAPRPTEIRLEVNDLALKVGETGQLTAILTPSNSETILSWTSGNPSVATVDNSGLVTGVSEGMSIITVSTAEGLNATATVTVSNNIIEATGIVISPSSAEIEVGKSLTLTATVTPENATNKSITWTSSNTSIAVVNLDGTVIGVSEGVTVITASCGEASAFCIVTVKPVNEITAETPTQLLIKGDGTSHTFIVMMDMANEALEVAGYKYVFGYDTSDGKSEVIANTSNRYAHTTSEIFYDPNNDFWAFAYYIDPTGEYCVSGRRYLDGRVDTDFDPLALIRILPRSAADEISGVYNMDGHYVGKKPSRLAPGFYILRKGEQAHKIIIR